MRPLPAPGVVRSLARTPGVVLGEHGTLRSPGTTPGVRWLSAVIIATRTPPGLPGGVRANDRPAQAWAPAFAAASMAGLSVSVAKCCSVVGVVVSGVRGSACWNTPLPMAPYIST